MKKIINNQRVKAFHTECSDWEIDSEINIWINKLNYKINILNITTASCGDFEYNRIIIFIHYEIV